MKQREYSIEVFRVAMMFGICFLHAISFGMIGTPVYNSVAMFCVNGFVLISGYFGCRLRVGKILSLYATAMWCIAVSLLYRMLVFDEVFETGFLDVFLLEFKGYWFLHAYVALMLAAPILDHAFVSEESADRRRLWGVALPFLLLVFGWGWVQTLGRAAFGDAARYIPAIPGYTGGGYALLVVAGTYVAGRVLRRCDFRGAKAALISVAGFALCYVATSYLPMWLKINSRIFAAYCSPFVLCMAAFAFTAIRSLKVPRLIGKAACLAAPSLFAVYLLQTTKLGMYQIRLVAQNLSSRGWESITVYLAVGVMLLFVCLALDVPRRILAAVARASFGRLLAWWSSRNAPGESDKEKEENG